MRATRLKAATEDGYIHLQLAKGVWLLLTQDEYIRGLNRGKAARRAQRRAVHQQRLQARQDATRLDWITE